MACESIIVQGSSVNVAKLLNELLPHQREDAVNSLAYEAEARVKDPVYGCVSAISVLQRHLQKLQKELDAANAHLLRYANMGLPLPPNNLYSGGDPLTTSHHASSSSSSSMVQAAPPNYPPPWSTCTNIFSGTNDQRNDIDIHTSGDHIIKGEESSL
ncbi:LOB domain-containing protein 25 [Canna indica]|uniref:LOB domain-containing protein 25 n=1 Tax=Canna indica TaxID=4628 RepID=A0AAQ3PYS5_9LILI|nr:LOB domain-containing protein 25 [Canna indica]